MWKTCGVGAAGGAVGAGAAAHGVVVPQPDVYVHCQGEREVVFRSVDCADARTSAEMSAAPGWLDPWASSSSSIPSDPGSGTGTAVRSCAFGFGHPTASVWETACATDSEYESESEAGARAGACSDCGASSAASRGRAGVRSSTLTANSSYSEWHRCPSESGASGGGGVLRRFEGGVSESYGVSVPLRRA